MTAPTVVEGTTGACSLPMPAARVSRRQALALIAAIPVALVADGSLPDIDTDDAAEARRRVGSAGLAFIACWEDVESRHTGAAYEREAVRGSFRIIRDLEARYGREETGRILREVLAVLADTLGGGRPCRMSAPPLSSSARRPSMSRQ